MLGDANPELVNCYQMVRDDVDAVIAELRKYRNTPAAYYRIRAKDPARLSSAERAARVIYLNRCGYNGLYRVNSGGQFNVPFGRYVSPTICDVSRLTAASRALKQNVEIVPGRLSADARRVPAGRERLRLPRSPLRAALADLLVHGLRAARLRHRRIKQRLADALGALSRSSVPAVLSNSYCRTTLQLYAGLKHQKVPARRAINSVGGSRGPVTEILVRTAAIV